MIKLDDLELVVALSRATSLSAAARALDVTPPALSMRLRKLETRLGLSLASRTARRLRLTAEGDRVAMEAESILRQLNSLSDSMHRDDHRLTGSLRIAASFGFGRRRLAPLLAEFALLHPLLTVSLDLRDMPWPAPADIDAVVHIGVVRDSSWVSRQLLANERWLCASPGYLRQYGAPVTKADIEHHACICIRENGEDSTLWSVQIPPTGHAKTPIKTETIRVTPRLTTNDGSVAMTWAKNGLGLVLRSQWDAADAVARGSLVRLVPDWTFVNAPVTLLMPTRRGRSARLQSLADFLYDRLT